MIRRLVIAGASGDLAARFLVPALARLHERHQLPEGFSILALARAETSTDAFREYMWQRLGEHAPEVSPAVRTATTEMITYAAASVTDGDALRAALGGIDEPVAIYLAVPPGVLVEAIGALSDLGLPEGSRIVIEKPFGEDLASAIELNRLLHLRLPESAVFRIDHFLAKQTIQNVLGLRFANQLFEPLWNRDHVERVEITWDETLALEGRSSYYDETGALRDMVQNHLLQLLCLLCMEPPVSIGPRDLRDRKVDLLRAVRRLSPDEVDRDTMRARYTAGEIDGRRIPSYVDEDGVETSRETETFAQVTLYIDNWRWAGVPFVLRTGKALRRKRSEMAVHFRQVPHMTFQHHGDPPVPNVLRFTLDPDSLRLGLNINGVDDFFDLEYVELVKDLAEQDLPAYAHILLEVLEGETALAIRDDESEESWRIVEPIVNAWADGRSPLREYAAGSDGPEIAASDSA